MATSTCTPQELLARLDARHDELLSRLDDLNDQILAALEELAGKRPVESPSEKLGQKVQRREAASLC